MPETPKPNNEGQEKPEEALMDPRDMTREAIMTEIRLVIDRMGAIGGKVAGGEAWQKLEERRKALASENGRRFKEEKEQEEKVESPHKKSNRVHRETSLWYQEESRRIRAIKDNEERNKAYETLKREYEQKEDARKAEFEESRKTPQERLREQEYKNRLKAEEEQRRERTKKLAEAFAGLFGFGRQNQGIVEPTPEQIEQQKRKKYLDILGASEKDSFEEIKKKWRELARLHHPDRNPGEKGAEDRFKEIQEAYEYLRGK